MIFSYFLRENIFEETKNLKVQPETWSCLDSNSGRQGLRWPRKPVRLKNALTPCVSYLDWALLRLMSTESSTLTLSECHPTPLSSFLKGSILRRSDTFTLQSIDVHMLKTRRSFKNKKENTDEFPQLVQSFSELWKVSEEKWAFQ